MPYIRLVVATFNAGLRATIEKLRETAEEAAGAKALPCLVA